MFNIILAESAAAGVMPVKRETLNSSNLILVCQQEGFILCPG